MLWANFGTFWMDCSLSVFLLCAGFGALLVDGSLAVFLLRAGLGMFLLLLLRDFRAHPCTANRRKNNAPHKESPHHNYEACLANRGTPTFTACDLCC